MFYFIDKTLSTLLLEKKLKKNLIIYQKNNSSILVFRVWADAIYIYPKLKIIYFYSYNLFYRNKIIRMCLD